MTLDIKEMNRVRQLLSETGKKMSDKEIEKLYYGFNSIINQIIDNNFSQSEICKKQ